MRRDAEFRAQLDATAENGVFAGIPWFRDEVEEMVDWALGCGALVEKCRGFVPPATGIQLPTHVALTEWISGCLLGCNGGSTVGRRSR